MEQKVRWGILSTAAIARETMIPAIQRANNAEVVAIASSSGKARSIAKELGIPVSYESYDQLLDDPNVDAVYIPLPNSMHVEWTIKAANKQKHVLCEKPAALCEADVRKMVEACKQNNVFFMEAFMYQFHPQHQRVKDIISSGEIGDIKCMRASFSFYLHDRETNIRMNAQLGGGSLFDVGCYCVHSIRNLLDSEPAELFVQSNYDEHRSIDKTTSGWMKMKNGVHALFDCSFEMFPQNKYEMIGAKGKVEVSRAYRPDVHGGNGIITVTTDSGETRKEVVFGDQYVLEMEHASRCILEDVEPLYSGDNMIQQARVLEACYTSVKTGNVVRL
jgi:D-xylose 1-dehydrogenase (NADP+, D-xylono-1,5-lactone-forming)